jgi:hypothetical protein
MAELTASKKDILPEPAAKDWRDAIRNSQTFGDIAAVFESEFPAGYAKYDYAENGVKAKKFKEWFGDWELLRKNPVQTTRLNGDEVFGDIPEKDMRKSALDYSKKNIQGKEIENDDTKMLIGVGRKGIDHILSHGINPQIFKSVAAVPQLIKRAVLVSTEPYVPFDKNIPFIHFFYAPLMVKDEFYIVKMVVTETNNGEKYYDHELIDAKIEKPAGIWTAPDQSDDWPPAASFSEVKISDLLQYVKPKHSISKVVNPDGSPMVVYHGTNVDFSMFDKGQVKSRFPYSFGFHFTSQVSEADAYSVEPAIDGGNVMPVYLRAVNPLVIITDMLTASMEADINRYDIMRKLLDAKKSGNPYDSVIIKVEKGNEYDGINIIVFDPTQIKSAIGNKGTFDPSSGSILESIDTEAHKSASSPKNDIPYPTPAQIAAGNYPKGHISIQGLDITIENPKGSTRRGVSKDGKAWENIIHHHYGYIKGTVGRDKDHIDVFIGDKTESPHVYVVNQVDPATGRFDEHKVMLGFESLADASDAYYANYEKGWKGMGSMTTQSMVDFKDWLEKGNTNKILESIVQPNQKPTIAQDQSKRAMKNTLDTQKNTMQGASRPDIGWIAFLWGNAGTAPLFADGDGLARIIAKQDFEKKYLPSERSGRELCMRLVDMLTRGFIKRKYGPTSRPKVDLSWQGEIATVSWDPDRKTWYLAAWREDWGGILESAAPDPPAIDVDGLRVAVTIDNDHAASNNVPSGWIVFNATRPLAGDIVWEGDNTRGRLYAAIDPHGDSAEWMVKENKSLDGWIYRDISTETMIAMVRQNYIDRFSNWDAGKVDAGMAKLNTGQIRSQFHNILEKLNYGTFKALLAKVTAAKQIKTGFKSFDEFEKKYRHDFKTFAPGLAKLADDYPEWAEQAEQKWEDENYAKIALKEIPPEQWRLDIRAATTFQNIADVFEREFGVTVGDTDD